MKKVLWITLISAVLFASSCSQGMVGTDIEDSTEPSVFSSEMEARAVATRPLFQMPVPAGESWSVSTWSGHNPALAADLNWGSTAEADFGKTIVSSFGGTVKTSVYSTNSGYGNYVVIDHGNGWTTWYCHLNSRSVSAGQKVSRGQKIGTCGRSSAKYNIATHLHYEQRLNNAVQPIYFNGTKLTYYQKINITSKSASYYVKTAGAALTIRKGPGTSYAAAGSVANGASVNIYAQTYGTTVTGTYGTSKIWDRIDGGYVSDTYIYTGSDGLVAPLE